MESAGPKLEVVERVLARATDSAPGPDGLRYRAWRAAGAEASGALHALLWAFMAGEPVPEDFAEALMIFLPKGEVEEDCVAVGRKASVTRPLGLMNSDAKVVQAAVAHSLSEHVAPHARGEQRGFVRHRHLAQNVLDMDTRMRIEGHRNSLFSFPTAVFFDFTVAFPSVDHEFLFMAMARCGIP